MKKDADKLFDFKRKKITLNNLYEKIFTNKNKIFTDDVCFMNCRNLRTRQIELNVVTGLPDDPKINPHFVGCF